MTHLEDFLSTADMLYFIQMPRSEQDKYIDNVEKKKVQTFLEKKTLNVRLQTLMQKQNRHSADDMIPVQ